MGQHHGPASTSVAHAFGQLYGMTCPLLTDAEAADGESRKKSGTVWLSPAKTSPYTFYQYWFTFP